MPPIGHQSSRIRLVPAGGLLSRAGTACSLVDFAATVYGQISNGYNLTYTGRIRWVVTGTGSPTFSGVSFSLFGR